MKKVVVFLSSLAFSALGFANEISDDPLNGALVAISPDHHWMALVETLKNQKIPEDCETLLGESGGVDQVWLYNLETSHKTLLISPHFDCDTPEKVIVAIDRIQFSLDSKKLYFETSGWVVSGALHVINLDGSHLRYIAPSNHFVLISAGLYAGDLAIAQHRYHVPLGSFDEYWAYTPEGKEKGSIGPDLSGFDYEENVFKEFDSSS